MLCHNAGVEMNAEAAIHAPIPYIALISVHKSVAQANTCVETLEHTALKKDVSLKVEELVSSVVRDIKEASERQYKVIQLLLRELGGLIRQPAPEVDAHSGSASKDGTEQINLDDDARVEGEQSVAQVWDLEDDVLSCYLSVQLMVVMMSTWISLPVLNCLFHDV